MQTNNAMVKLISQPKNRQLDPHVPAVNNTPKYIKNVAPPKVHSESLQRYK